MRKADLPVVCDVCSKTFPSEAAKQMHKRAKHKVLVHGFEELAQKLKDRQDIAPVKANLFWRVLLWPFKALLPKGNKSPNSPKK